MRLLPTLTRVLRLVADCPASPSLAMAADRAAARLVAEPASVDELVGLLVEALERYAGRGPEQRGRVIALAQGYGLDPEPRPTLVPLHQDRAGVRAA